MIPLACLYDCLLLSNGRLKFAQNGVFRDFSGSRDSHVSRDTRELLRDHDRTFHDLSIDTSG